MISVFESLLSVVFSEKRFFNFFKNKKLIGSVLIIPGGDFEENLAPERLEIFAISMILKKCLVDFEGCLAEFL